MNELEIQEEMKRCENPLYFAEKYVFKRPLRDFEKKMIDSLKDGDALFIQRARGRSRMIRNTPKP